MPGSVRASVLLADRMASIIKPGFAVREFAWHGKLIRCGFISAATLKILT
jgi:hypothetical protein